MIYLIISFSAVLILLYKLFKAESNYWKKNNIVSESGTLWKFLTGDQSLAEIYKQIYDAHKNELYVGITQGSKPALLLVDLENVQAVLSGDFQSFHSRGIDVNPNDLLADNVLFIEDYARWKLLRQKLSPVFTSLRLKNMFYILEKCARDFVELMKDNEKAKSNPFDALYTYSTASIGASVFGIDTKLNNTMESPFLDMTRQSVTPTFQSNLSFFINNSFPSLSKFLNLNQFGAFEDFFIGVVRNVLKSRRQKNENNAKHDFIDICWELQESHILEDNQTGYSLKPTDEILAAQAFFFFIAGADTSANSMHFTLLELSNHPAILKRVHEEIDKIFDENNENLTYSDIDKLQYLDMVINESMRKYPPIGLMQRKCTKDTVLPAGNLKIEKGMIAVIPVFGIHRDDRYFPDPENFDPERFSSDNYEKLVKFSYIPFGEGNRICLGMRYARLQIKAGLAWLLRRFTLVEQNYVPKKFEKSFFSLRDPTAKYDLVPRCVQ